MLALAPGALAEGPIPPGTVLATQLNSSLDSQKAKPGQKVTLRVMQDVPGTKVHAGAKVIGHVISVQRQDGNSAHLTLRLDRLNFDHQSVPINTSLRAIASMMEVEDAQVPPMGTDRGSPWAWMSRNLIGGEVAYGQGGPVVHGSDVVGTALFDGVLAPAQSNRSGGCRGEVNGNSKPQALWVFASDACGVYGIDVQITYAGRTAPIGEITLTSTSKSLKIQSGSGMLLRVNGQ